MCGRITLRAADSELQDFFDLSEKVATSPRYNIAPSQNIWAIRASNDGESRRASLLHWGLIPPWAEDKRVAYRMINARVETARTRPSFRDSYRSQRCLIPASGYYEWKTSGKSKQPFLIERPDRSLLALAGLWARWKSPQGEIVESCTIITTDASPRLSEVHHRMPLIVAHQNFRAWLNPNAPPTDHLLAPYPHDDLQLVPVSTYVNNAAHDDPRCLEPGQLPEQLDLLT